MSLWNPSTLTRISGFAGSICSLAFFIGLGALYLRPSLTPVGTITAIILSAITLSLPLWAAGIVYSSYVKEKDTRADWMQFLLASLTLLFLVGGIAMIFVGMQSISNALYLIGTGLLLFVSVLILIR
ncbi:MAG: hypothetical protein ABEI06_01260 [Halobacteriaceae archaeon]